MSPEIRRNNWEGVIYKNDNLNVPETAYCLTCEFAEDEDIRRVRMNWSKTHNDGRIGYWVGRMYHPVREVNGNEPADYELVVWDGENSVSGIHASKIEFI